MKQKEKTSFGPLGTLIRTHRNHEGLSLAQVAKACDCSVQFISNIEHGRAPLPWEKARVLSEILKIDTVALESANFAVRSDFKSFVAHNGTKKTAVTPAGLTITMKDKHLQRVLERYHSANATQRKRFVDQALKLLN